MLHSFYVFYICEIIKLLFRYKNITRYLSGFLLLVFVLGICPKSFLHNIFSKHIDSVFKKKSGSPLQLTTAGYNCDCDNLVAESSFVNNPQEFSFPIFTSFSSCVIDEVSYSSISKFYSSLRGPPVKI